MKTLVSFNLRTYLVEEESGDDVLEVCLLSWVIHSVLSRLGNVVLLRELSSV